MQLMQIQILESQKAWLKDVLQPFDLLNPCLYRTLHLVFFLNYAMFLFVYPFLHSFCLGSTLQPDPCNRLSLYVHPANLFPLIEEILIFLERSIDQRGINWTMH